MAGIRVVVDNSVLSDLGSYLEDPNSVQQNKMNDVKAFKKIIKLDHEAVVEILIPASGAQMEFQRAPYRQRRLVIEYMGKAYRTCPVAVSHDRAPEIEQKKKCLAQIMQDKDGTDSRIIVASTMAIPARYYLTTDYKYVRGFRDKAARIESRCGIYLHILSPSEFLKKYEDRQL